MSVIDELRAESDARRAASEREFYRNVPAAHDYIRAVGCLLDLRRVLKIRPPARLVMSAEDVRLIFRGAPSFIYGLPVTVREMPAGSVLFEDDAAPP